MSGKVGGVRAYWGGGRLLSRPGNEFFAPAWFTERLPKTPLDGELWGGRRQFQRTVSTVRRQDRGEAWREIRYLVFDLPSMRAPFEQRYAELARLVAELGAPHVEAHAHAECESLDALRAELARVTRVVFEGLGGVSYARCDFRVDAEGRAWFLEVNTTCGVFYPPGAEGCADHILLQGREGREGHAEFVTRILDAALARRRA